MIFANESGILNGFLSEILNVGLGTNYSDISRVAVVALIGESNVLSDEHADTNSRHVKAIEEGLDGAVDLHALTLALVLEDTLGHCCHDTIMAALDVVKSLCETLVVKMEICGPIAGIVDHCEITP